MKLIGLTVGPLGTNCYIAYDEMKNAVIVDPGGDYDRINRKLTDSELSLKAILLTHGHFDHIGAVKELADAYGCEVYIGQEDMAMLEDTRTNLSSSFTRNPMVYKGAKGVADGEELTFGDMSFKVIFTPGHTPGGVCFYAEKDEALFAGDTLFCQSVGRSDFPGGSAGTLVRSIRERLMVLPEDTSVLPGHGETTTIGYEKVNNPFI